MESNEPKKSTRSDSRFGPHFIMAVPRQIINIVDLQHWKSATSWHGRLAAVSWPRAGVIGGIAAALLGLGIYAATPKGLRAYPPPLPAEHVRELRQKQLEQFKTTPPQGLVEANRSAQREKSS
ncbi:hypothetical protein D3C75_978720 [compost metagenome]|jgi:hypothetical protein